MAPRCENPKVIIRVISFELVQPICPRYVNVTADRWTDRRTDGQTDDALRYEYEHLAVKNCSQFFVLRCLFWLFRLRGYKFLFCCASDRLLGHCMRPGGVCPSVFCWHKTDRCCWDTFVRYACMVEWRRHHYGVQFSNTDLQCSWLFRRNAAITLCDTHSTRDWSFGHITAPESLPSTTVVKYIGKLLGGFLPAHHHICCHTAGHRRAALPLRAFYCTNFLSVGCYDIIQTKQESFVGFCKLLTAQGSCLGHGLRFSLTHRTDVMRRDFEGVLKRVQNGPSDLIVFYRFQHNVSIFSIFLRKKGQSQTWYALVYNRLRASMSVWNLIVHVYTIHCVSKKSPRCLRLCLWPLSTDFNNFWQTYTTRNLQDENILVTNLVCATALPCKILITINVHGYIIT